MISPKYGLVPDKIEERSLDPNDGKYFQEVYDLVRLRKIQNNQIRNDKYNQKINWRKRNLRNPLPLTEKVLVLAERLTNKDDPGRLYKSSTENMPSLVSLTEHTRYDPRSISKKNKNF